MAFQFEQLAPALSKAIVSMGFSEPTEIQSQAIPLLINNDIDFVGQAQTGTGKTAAFLIPLLSRIDDSKKHIQALILTPTRELANQIGKEIDKLSSHMNVQTALVYGGVGYRQQIDQLRRAHIVVATPGRAIDLLNQKKIDLSQTEVVILDEADEMLKMGFIDDVDTLLDEVPNNSLHWLFSATLSKPIQNLISKKLQEPEYIKVQKKTESSELTEQFFYKTDRSNHLKVLKLILLNEPDFYGIVFCETKDACRRLSEKMAFFGIKSGALHGDLSQGQRDQAVELFKAKKTTLLVCTDVAARGIDIPDLTHVINMGLPQKRESYVHRVGRTGRAGKSGKAITLVSPGEMRSLKYLERDIKTQLKPFKIDQEEVKKQIVAGHLDQYSNIRDAIVEKQEDFQVDEQFEAFDNFFEGLSREQLLKLMFVHGVQKSLRAADEVANSMVKTISYGEDRPVRSDRRRSRRRDGGRRDGGRREGGRDGGRRDGGRREMSGNRERSDRRSSGRSGGRSSGRRGQRSGARSSSDSGSYTRH